MKIAHINLAKGIRGGENQTLAIIEGLKSFDIEQTLVCRKNSDIQKRAANMGIEVLPIGKPFLLNSRKLKGFDILHVHEGRSIYIAYLANILYKTPYLVTRRIPNMPHKKRVTKLAYKKAECIVSLSRKIDEVMREFVNSRHNEIIPSIARDLTVDESEVKKLEKRFEGKFIVGHIGALNDHHKNQSLIIKAAKELKDNKKIVFILLGSGKDEKMLKEMASGQDNIIFEGFKTNIADYYAIFDIFVYPSKEEGLGSAILEAFGFRLPVIASDVDGIPDIVKDQKTGILIRPDDHMKLKESILSLYHDKSLKENLSKNGYEFKKEFSSKIITEKYFDLYKKIVNKI